MDLKAQLLKEHSKQNSLMIRKYLLNHPSRIDEFMGLFFGDVYRLSQRAAMVVSALFDYDKRLMEPYKTQMVHKLEIPNLNVAVKRNIVRILQEVYIEEDQLTSLFDSCINFIQSPSEPVAVKAFSMKVIVNICKRYPELKQEAYPIINEEVKRNESKGIQARGKAMLSQLEKI